ncbi:glycosyltransferase family 61 protein [Acidisoma silvae]|uniref:Glycosyltransferase family 61 protein n=1 Tax=Acidisoma silvae TaxID=2802396 RepID=A0A963YWA0_9PROT|nr:glycosyltransferase family 61 protein [Acidisoma silvae]MCB8878377.1 glycosyltransferase family 61 protein [Acidisoma silvae]
MAPPILNRQKLDSLGAERIRLAKSASILTVNATRYNNIGEFDAAFGLHYERDLYAARQAQIRPIDLVKLEDSIIYPDVDYVVTANGGIAVDEQMPPWMPAGTVTPDAMLAAEPSEEITPETVIIARFGVGTWGHWLGELLPKLVMVEAAFPGRFHYAVPAEYLNKGPEHDPWKTFRQSLAAYGIANDRVAWLRTGRSYRLRNAWAVTPVWSDHLLHPRAAEAMRCGIKIHTDLGLETNKIALLRQSNAARSLTNATEIDAVLQKNGFSMQDIAALDFIDQVAVFRRADGLFSTLGSGLTGLIYSPTGVRVTSVAPSLFGDRFFYAMIQDRQGLYADVRGPIVDRNEAIPHRSSFSIDPERLQLGLDSLAP